MKLKLNWGTGITIALALTIGGMLCLVYIATRQEFFLVEKDYYRKGITYQEQIDRISNTNTLREKPQFKLDTDQLSIQFPQWFAGKNISGEIWLYNAANEHNDQSFSLQLDSNLMQAVSLASANRGKYTIKLNWTANEVPYYIEQQIQLE